MDFFLGAATLDSKPLRIKMLLEPNPHMKAQAEAIERLNEMIESCEAYTNVDDNATFTKAITRGAGKVLVKPTAGRIGYATDLYGSLLKIIAV